MQESYQDSTVSQYLFPTNITGVGYTNYETLDLFNIDIDTDVNKILELPTEIFTDGDVMNVKHETESDSKNSNCEILQSDQYFNINQSQTETWRETVIKTNQESSMRTQSTSTESSEISECDSDMLSCLTKTEPPYLIGDREIILPDDFRSTLSRSGWLEESEVKMELSTQNTTETRG